jgi:hypothetical protein
VLCAFYLRELLLLSDLPELLLLFFDDELLVLPWLLLVWLCDRTVGADDLREAEDCELLTEGCLEDCDLCTDDLCDTEDCDFGADDLCDTEDCDFGADDLCDTEDCDLCVTEGCELRVVVCLDV